RTGNHLVVYPNGKFGCTAHPGDKAHRRRIAQLVGDPDRQIRAWTLRRRGKAPQHPAPTAISIASLARRRVQILKGSDAVASEMSVMVFSDKTDANNPITDCTATHDDPVQKGLPCTPSETSVTPFSDNTDACKHSTHCTASNIRRDHVQ